MGNWYECRVKYEKTLADGSKANVREDYLLDAVSITEAEARVVKEIGEAIDGEFDVDSVKKARIAEIFEDKIYQGAAEKWYKAKVWFVTLDEKSGEEKRKGATMFVKSMSVKDAVFALERGMIGTMEAWELAAMVETTILDVWGPEAMEENKNGEV